MFPSSSSSSFPRLRLNVLQKSLNSWKFSDFSSSVPYSWPDTKREWQCLHVTMMRWNASWKDHHQKSPRRSAHAQQTDIQNWISLLQFYSQLSCDLENGSSLKLIWKCKAQWKPPSSCKVPNISLSSTVTEKNYNLIRYFSWSAVHWKCVHYFNKKIQGKFSVYSHRAFRKLSYPSM